MYGRSFAEIKAFFFCAAGGINPIARYGGGDVADCLTLLQISLL